MDGEAEHILSAMESKKEQKICGKRVICGHLFCQRTAVVICGVGKVNAACGVQTAVDVLGADTVINVGVAGGLNGSVEIGKTYAVSHAVQYDFDLTQLNGTPVGTLNEFETNYLPLAVNGAYPARKLGTGDRFNDSPDDYRLLTETLGADLRDMEGGAMAQACAHAGVPLFMYKTVSDIAGSGSTTEQYKKNLALCFAQMKSEIKDVFNV